MELVKSVSIENMVNQRVAVIERLDAARGLIEEARKIAGMANIGFPEIAIDRGYRRSAARFGNADDVDKAIRQSVDASAWKYLMEESGLRTFMDAEARGKWDKQIYEGEVPELTLETVAATFKGLYDARGDMFERGVIECFRSLSWVYKTNLPQMFGKRIVMTYLHSGGYCGSYSKCDKLDDLIRVMSVLDGKPEPDHRQGARSQIDAALNATRGQGYPKFVESDYVSVKLFKNGNGHVTFKRPDLVRKLNAIIAKHYPGALPAPK